MGLVRKLVTEVINAAQQPSTGAPPPPGNDYAQRADPATEKSVGTKDAARGSDDLDYKHEAAAPYTAPAPSADMGRQGGEPDRKRGRLRAGLRSLVRPLKGYENPNSKMRLRYINACGMAKSPELRRTQSLDVSQGLAFTLIIVGAIFLGLTASGNFMGSVQEMKYVGIYAPAIAKYSAYIFAGLTGVIGALLARRACSRGTSLLLSTLVLATAAAATLASLGLTIYLISKGSEVGSAWWTYLLDALMIVQRVLYLIMLGYLLYTIKEAATDESVRQQMIQAQLAHEASKSGAAVPPPAKDAAMV